ncbi:hypothetical protein ACFRAR_03115 [Kitasatospora sp. NPDC056651]|uniref:hypothetical protein n=1 Tax=Kitasatospora sp. NPDC056651 TaxID=3345892 RepID=UPI0036A69397
MTDKHTDPLPAPPGTGPAADAPRALERDAPASGPTPTPTPTGPTSAPAPARLRTLDLIALVTLLVIATGVYLTAGSGGFSVITSVGAGLYGLWRPRR